MPEPLPTFDPKAPLMEQLDAARALLKSCPEDIYRAETTKDRLYLREVCEERHCTFENAVRLVISELETMSASYGRKVWLMAAAAEEIRTLATPEEAALP